MIADLKPYSAMNDSAVPWLGEVPEHSVLRSEAARLRSRGKRGTMIVAYPPSLCPARSLLAGFSFPWGLM